MGQPQAPDLKAALEPVGKFDAAINQLTISAETCENNAPIHEAEGNTEQAELSRASAVSYRAAIEHLQNA